MLDIAKIVDVVKTTAAAFIPDWPQAIAAGEAVLDLVRSVWPTLTAEDQDALAAALPALLTEMNLNVDQAIADLIGAGR